MLTFCPNVRVELRASIQQVLDLSLTHPHDKYLRLPAFLGRNKQEAFKFIKNLLMSKLQVWGIRLFLYGWEKDIDYSGC